MNRLFLLLFGALLFGAILAIAASGCSVQASEKPVSPEPGSQGSSTRKKAAEAKKTMRAFRSEEELTLYLRQLEEKQKRGSRRAVLALEAPAPAASKAYDVAGNSDSVTNVQHAGVDEGDIVKVHGNHLVVLRRGRLFTVAIGKGELSPVSSVNAYAPDIDPSGTWYDEMLVSSDTVVVIGYSYQRGGTEVGLFNIDSAGNLTYRSTYHLRSNDYYSSRNYASRLIGSKLIFYSPLYMYSGANPVDYFPALRKWHRGATASEFRRIAWAPDVYKPERPLNVNYGFALHTVTVCDLAGGRFDCKATSVIGPWGRVFYVSPEAVYVWMTDWAYDGQKQRPESMVYRMPLDGSAPSALGVAGSPVDQFSFLESEDGYLNVLVRSDGAGDGMWKAEVTTGDTAMMRVPIETFSDGSSNVPPSRYRPLPAPQGDTFQNRFIGDYLLYGTGNGWWYPQKTKNASLFAVRWAGGDIHELVMNHGVDRIEALGSDAVAIGTDGRNLHFTSVRLGRSPEVIDDYSRQLASQGETRSHGFFYKPDTRDSGMLGLPISRPGRAGYRQLFENSAAILFLKNDSLHFEEAGELAAQPEHARDDSCHASCVDWYGNARPLFVRGRVIAMLGYELVEGKLERGEIEELNRVSFAPGSVNPARDKDEAMK